MFHEYSLHMTPEFARLGYGELPSAVIRWAPQDKCEMRYASHCEYIGRFLPKTTEKRSNASELELSAFPFLF